LPAKVSGASRYRALDPVKDIESVHPIGAGLLALGQPRYVPSTPASVFHLVDRYLVESGRDPAQTYDRSNLGVVGRSANVGKPALMLAMERGATVVSCDEHSHGAGLLFEHTARADILVVAAGVPGLICGEHVKDGVIAVDVGINESAIPRPQRSGSSVTSTPPMSPSAPPRPRWRWSSDRCLATPEHRGRRTPRTGHRGVLPVDRGTQAKQSRMTSIGVN